MESLFSSWDGALIVNKPAGISSFGVIEELQRMLVRKHGVKRKEVPKMGHGGTLDPFATGLLLVCVGRGVKLSRYFLGSDKQYDGTLRFGESTESGDPTTPVIATSDRIPDSIEDIRRAAAAMKQEPYLQTPPMYSAKKKDGKALYELARQGIAIERDAKLCHLHEFEVLGYEKPRATIRVKCSSGTYIRTLAEDLAKRLGSVAVLETLNRSGSGSFRLDQGCRLGTIAEATERGEAWTALPCWIPFNRMMASFGRAEASRDEAVALMQGKQKVLGQILHRSVDAQEPSRDCVVIYQGAEMVAIARREQDVWGLERVFTGSPDQGDSSMGPSPNR